MLILHLPKKNIWITFKGLPVGWWVWRGIHPISSFTGVVGKGGSFFVSQGVGVAQMTKWQIAAEVLAYSLGMSWY